MNNRYGTFIAMILTSMVSMFIMTYLNSWEFSHLTFNETRVYMVMYMGSVMAIIMLAFMLKMYTSTKANLAIVLSAVVLFSGSLYLVRSQKTVEDVSWMKAMIPHHSIAILTSSRANILDPRVRKLAEDIVKAQELEIAEMKALIKDLEGGTPATPELDGK